MAEISGGRRWLPCDCGERLIEMVVNGRSYAARTDAELYAALAGKPTHHDVYRSGPAARSATRIASGDCHPPSIVELGGGIRMTTIETEYTGRRGLHRKRSNNDHE